MISESFLQITGHRVGLGNPLNLQLVSEVRWSPVGTVPSNFSVGLYALRGEDSSPFSSPLRIKCALGLRSAS